MKSLILLLLVAAVANAEFGDEALPVWMQKLYKMNKNRLWGYLPEVPEEEPEREVRADSKWSTCGGDGSVIVHELHIPSVIKMPSKQIPISFDIEVTKDIANFAVEMSVEKKMGLWITVPCIKDVGSCKYPDLCKLAASNQTIVDELAKNGLYICPFKQQRLTHSIHIDIPKAPSFIGGMVAGRYRTQVKMNYFPASLKKTHICFKIEIELKD